MQWTASKIVELRRKLGLTQTELAAELGCRQQTISEWELGLYAPGNAYGKLLDVLERQIRISAPFVQSTMGKSAGRPEPAPVNPVSMLQPAPKTAREIELEPAEPITSFDLENTFDKGFDPGID